VNFKQSIAKYLSGNLTISQISQVAYEAILEGYDSPSLYILAGLENENAFVIQQYFNATLEELSIAIPGKRKAAIEYANGLAEDIIEGKRELIAGVREMRYSAIDSYDFFSETTNFVYDSIFFEYVYGLFVDYDDFEAEHSWVGDQEAIDTLSDIRIKLMDELKKWNEKISTYLDTIS